MPTLFDPIRVGSLDLPNRIFMAPMTRRRAGDERVPNALMAEYYTQRADAGLIVTEGVVVTPRGLGYGETPGLWSRAQVEGWKQVTRAVHDAGGRIYAQLWHVGRISHPMFLGGGAPVAPSAIAANGNVSLLRPPEPFPIPHALTREEIWNVVAAFRLGAQNADEAGFDGVQLHGANGYLFDQFLQTISNKRDDEYGGSIENRARLLLETTDAAISVLGADRVAVHIAPRGDTHSMGDDNPRALFTHVATKLGERKIAFLSAREFIGPDSLGPALKTAFGGVYVVNEKLTFETATQALAEGRGDAAMFGKPYLANPDLVTRFRKGAPLNEPDMSTFYAIGATGYLDYPTLAPIETLAR
jgi:2,4-dienoyl-CoA reductase-like NADH-dependent reductase (Old Yellow Enzyme family)